MNHAPIDERRVGRVAELHGIEWIYRQQTESTNSDVLNYYAEHRAECVAVSEAQSAGRGRRGRQWLSPFAHNNYCTIGLIKALPTSHQGLLSIVTGIALCSALQQTFAAQVKLKWPNDLICNSGKLGGILIESRPHDDASIFFAIGFGVNVFMPADELAAIAQPVTTLARETAASIDRADVFIACINAVVDAIRAFDPARSVDLIAEFRQYDAFYGARVDVDFGQQRVSGINRGIDCNGQLQLETDHGLQRYAAAEISMRPVNE